MCVILFNDVLVPFWILHQYVLVWNPVFGHTKMASFNVYACWAKFKREQLSHLLRVGELILSFAIGTITLISYGTQFWVETADYRHGLWINCSTKPNVPCVTLPLVVDHGKGIEEDREERNKS